jgi:peptide/nickel transport system substrate-binding protein
LIKVMTGGKGQWALPASLPDMWTQQEIHQIWQFDPTQAKQLLADAGYAKGLSFEVMFTASRPEDVQLSQLIQAQLKNVGISLALKQVDVATFGARQHTGDFDSSLAAAVFFADLDSRLSGVYLTGSGSNYTGLSDPKLDQQIEAQRREADPAKREVLLKDASRYIAQNYYETTLYRQVLTTFWHPQVKNYADNWVQLDWNAAGVWLER